MKLKVAAAAIALAGFATAVAVAQGSPPGRGPDDGSSAAIASASRTTAARVGVCHRTASAKNPFRAVTVAREALEAHMRHGDLLARAGGGCAARAAPLPGSPAAEQTAS